MVLLQTLVTQLPSIQDTDIGNCTTVVRSDISKFTKVDQLSLRRRRQLCDMTFMCVCVCA